MLVVDSGQEEHVPEARGDRGEDTEVGETAKKQMLFDAGPGQDLTNHEHPHQTADRREDPSGKEGPPDVDDPRLPRPCWDGSIPLYE